MSEGSQRFRRSKERSASLEPVIVLSPHLSSIQTTLAADTVRILTGNTTDIEQARVQFETADNVQLRHLSACEVCLDALKTRLIPDTLLD